MGLVSGGMLAIASRMSNVLCKSGGLYHEAYITLYAQIVCVSIIPLFIVTNAKRLSHLDNGESTDNDTNTKLIRLTTYVFIFLVIFIKVYVLERGTMSRFVEDYNEEVHELPSGINYFFGKSIGVDNDTIEEEAVSDLDHKSEEEDSEVFENKNKEKIGVVLRERSASERYNKHVQASRRGTVNLQVCTLIWLYCVYLLTYEAGVDIEDDNV